MNYKVLLKFGVTMVTAFLMINTYVFANNSQTSETMQLQYIFTDEVLSCVNSIAAGGTIISSVDLDKEKTVVVMLKKSQTTEKAISLFETIEGVLYAERNKMESLVTPIVPALTLNKQVTAKSNVIVTSQMVNGYNNMIITDYSQMKKLIEKYKVSVYKDKKILNQMNTYDEAFFKKYSLCLLVYQKTYGYKISIGGVYLEQNSGGIYKLNVSLNVKEPDRTKGYPQIMKTHFCFVEISKKAIIPSKQNINVKKPANRKMKLTWNKDVGVSGYQIQYCADSKFKDGIKTITIKNNMAVEKTISNLKKGKTYYVRVRSYRNIKLNGKTNAIYGSWSRVKKSGKV